MPLKFSRNIVGLCVALALAFAGVIPAKAAPPANDDFGSPIVIGALPYTTAQDTSEATAAADDPTECHNRGSVWYAFTPATNMVIRANTIGSQYDTTLAVYTGTQGALTLVPGACNDDFYGLQSRVQFSAVGGITYYFLLGACCGTGGSGGGSLTFSVQELIPPTNDNFADASVIGGLPFSDSVDSSGATVESGEPHLCGGSSQTQSVWYVFTPNTSTIVSADMDGSSFSDTNLTIFESVGPGFDNLSFIDRTCFGGSLRFSVQAGTTYYLQAESFSSDGGDSHLNLQEVPPPSNDNFANATPIPLPLPFDDSVDTLAATVEADEPAPSCSNPSKTAWYSFTPTTSGMITASVNSNFGPMVAAYAGNSLASLTEVGCRPYWNQPLSFLAEAGTTYYLQVGGVFGEGGLIQFRVEVTPPPFAGFSTFHSDPSIFDTIGFCDSSFDPGGVGFASFEWDFGDGATSTGFCTDHRYATDGDYTVQHNITTIDGRTASASQPVQVRTRDVSIVKVSAPNTANAGQKKTITISLKNTRYPENVTIELYKAVPGGGYEWVASLTKLVPVRKGNRTTQFSFNYTFTTDDAQIGKVIFRAVVYLESGRDAFPADNEAISTPPTLVKGRISYP